MMKSFNAYQVCLFIIKVVLKLYFWQVCLEYWSFMLLYDKDMKYECFLNLYFNSQHCLYRATDLLLENIMIINVAGLIFS